MKIMILTHLEMADDLLAHQFHIQNYESEMMVMKALSVKLVL